MTRITYYLVQYLLSDFWRLADVVQTSRFDWIVFVLPLLFLNKLAHNKDIEFQIDVVSYSFATGGQHLLVNIGPREIRKRLELLKTKRIYRRATPDCSRTETGTALKRVESTLRAIVDE